jgi:ankyrin repeat protein
LATKYASLGVAKLSLSNKAEVDVTNSHLETPVDCARQRPFIQIINLLIDSGADLLAKNGDGLDALELVMAKCGTEFPSDPLIEVIFTLLAEQVDHCLLNKLTNGVGTSDVSSVDVKLIHQMLQRVGVTPGIVSSHLALQVAIGFRHESIPLDFIEPTDDLNKVTRHGNTIYHLAASVPNRSILQAIILEKSKVAICNKLNYTPLHIAAHQRRPDLCFALLSHDDEPLNMTGGPLAETAMHIACRNGDENVASLFIGFGADFSIQNMNGSTALALAQQEKHTALCEVLKRYTSD